MAVVGGRLYPYKSGKRIPIFLFLNPWLVSYFIQYLAFGIYLSDTLPIKIVNNIEYLKLKSSNKLFLTAIPIIS